MLIFVFWCWCFFARIRQIQIWVECEALFEYLSRKDFKLQPRSLRARWVFVGSIGGKDCRLVFQSMIQGHRMVFRCGDYRETVVRITQPLQFERIVSKVSV